MKMTRADKTKLVEGIREKFLKADAAFLTEYQGIQATKMSDFRRGLKEASVEFKVVRNTLARLAVDGTDAAHMKELFKGPVAMVFSYGDAAGAAKKLTEFAKDNPKLKVLAGTLGAKPITMEEIKGLAELPSREVLLAKMLGSMTSPVSGLVGVLSGVPRKLLYALNAIQGQKAAAS